MAPRGSSQRNQFYGALSNQDGLLMAGAQLSTGGGDIHIYGGASSAGGHFPHRIAVRGDGWDSGDTAGLLEREGLCVLCIGESAQVSLYFDGEQRTLGRSNHMRRTLASDPVIAC